MGQSIFFSLSTERGKHYQLSLSNQVKFFHFRPRPGGFSEEFQARFDAGVVGEAADRDDLAQFFPAVISDQVIEDVFQFYTVEGVVGLRFWHGAKILKEEWIT
jgi:hypothetical protein